MFAVSAALALFASSVGQPADNSPHSEGSLVPTVRQAAPGQPFMVGIRIKLEEHWHCYWRNPGDSGLATEVVWDLPSGWQVSPMQWARPKEILWGGFRIYGYEGEAWKFVTLVPPADAKPGSAAEIRADMRWLVCKETCIPARQSVSYRVPIGDAAVVHEANEELVRTWYREVPTPDRSWSFSARRVGNNIQIRIGIPNQGQLPGGTRFLPDRGEVINHSVDQRVERSGDGWLLTVPISEFAYTPPTRARGLLMAPEGQVLPNGRQAVAFDAAILPPR